LGSWGNPTGGKASQSEGSDLGERCRSIRTVHAKGYLKRGTGGSMSGGGGPKKKPSLGSERQWKAWKEKPAARGGVHLILNPKKRKGDLGHHRYPNGKARDRTENHFNRSLQIKGARRISRPRTSKSQARTRKGTRTEKRGE